MESFVDGMMIRMSDTQVYSKENIADILLILKISLRIKIIMILSFHLTLKVFHIN